MQRIAPQTGLAALPAVAIDCETTGLDSRSARIVQLAAVQFGHDEQTLVDCFDQIINPGVPIPAATTAIHGLDADSVTGQPPFIDIAQAFLSGIGERVLIGHSVRFDIAMLEREFQLAQINWRPGPSLDIRLLAQIAVPTLSGHDLDRLANWLNIRIEGRHSALGDARATAEIFLKLLPLLREKGIRTLAQAQFASQALLEHEARRAGDLADLRDPVAALPQALIALDPHVFRHRVHEVITSPARIVSHATLLPELSRQMLQERISSVFVEWPDASLGIVTERDALRAWAERGVEAQTLAASEVASRPLVAVSEDDYLYRAIGRMDRLGIRHLAVLDTQGRVVGAVTPRNLLRNRATRTMVIGDAVASASRGDQLQEAWSKVVDVAASLRADGVSARDVASVISAEIRAITARSTELAVQYMREQGQGDPPCRFSVLVLGSAGRGESLLAADQDNALILERGEPGGVEDQWFTRMATRLCAILDESGIEYCRGGVMAMNAQWRHSVVGWNRTAAEWVRRKGPADLLNVDIFFDATLVYGDRSLADAVISEAQALAQGSADFLALLTELARRERSPFNFFGGFQTEHGRIDAKKTGLLPIFTGARVLAMRQGVSVRTSADRLQAVSQRGIVSSSVVERILAAHETLLGVVLDQQLLDLRAGKALSSRVDTEGLSKARNRELKHAFSAVTDLLGVVGEGRV